jgi:hypothetical protein
LFANLIPLKQSAHHVRLEENALAVQMDIFLTLQENVWLVLSIVEHALQQKLSLAFSATLVM